VSKGTVSGGGDGLYTATIERNDGSSVTMPAWCCDLTEDLGGTVGIIEIAGDREKGINLQPGFEGNAVYNASRDGELKQIQKFPTTSPTQEVYWNWAMRPGWQKWKPNYRYGTITAIDYDADTCDVALDACYATDTPDGQQLDINQSSSLSGVPIEYMDCDSAPFEVGDNVLVKFEGQAWASPKVIGFKEEPKACGSQYLCVWGIGNPGGEDCFAWDLLTNAPASIKDDSGNPVTFPIKKANISTWLSNHKELDGVEELWSRTSDTSGNWVCTPPGPLDEVYHRTCTRENTFGTSTKEEWYRYGTVEGDSDHSPMWCEGDWILSGEDSNLKGGYHYTANNGSDEVVDLTWEVSTFEQETAWGSWVEGGEPSGGRSATESESRTYTIPIFDVIQSGSKSRSGTCETDQLSILE
jgi:hypothetical protein